MSVPVAGLCGISGAYQIFSTPDHEEQWRDGRCTLPRGHDPALAYHEYNGLRLTHHGRRCPCDTCRGSLR